MQLTCLTGSPFHSSCFRCTVLASVSLFLCVRRASCVVFAYCVCVCLISYLHIFVWCRVCVCECVCADTKMCERICSQLICPCNAEGK